jgi:hypothetical protein
MKNICRCGHYNTMHWKYWGGSVATTYDSLICGGYIINGKCLCKEYIPKDNLEYLEQLYEKKVQHGQVRSKT